MASISSVLTVLRGVNDAVDREPASEKRIEEAHAKKQQEEAMKNTEQAEYMLNQRLIRAHRETSMYISSSTLYMNRKDQPYANIPSQFTESIRALHFNIQIYLALKDDPEDKKEFLKIIVNNLKVTMKYLGEADKNALDQYTRQCIASIKDLNDTLSKIDYLPLIDKKV